MKSNQINLKHLSIKTQIELTNIYINQLWKNGEFNNNENEDGSPITLQQAFTIYQENIFEGNPTLEIQT